MNQQQYRDRAYDTRLVNLPFDKILRRDWGPVNPLLIPPGF
jgi:hypothetical protein